MGSKVSKNAKKGVAITTLNGEVATAGAGTKENENVEPAESQQDEDVEMRPGSATSQKDDDANANAKPPPSGENATAEANKSDGDVKVHAKDVRGKIETETKANTGEANTEKDANANGEGVTPSGNDEVVTSTTDANAVRAKAETDANTNPTPQATANGDGAGVVVTPTTTAGASKVEIDELVKSRKDGCQKKAKERIAEDLKVIEPKTEANPERPYGLPKEMKGDQKQVWERIFKNVQDVEAIINLHEVSKLFNKLLEKKCIETVLPYAMWLYFGDQDFNSDEERKGWLQTLSTFRLVSRQSKYTIDSLISGGLIEDDGSNWFSTNSPHYIFKKQVPVLHLGASKLGQQRLKKTLEQLKNVDKFPLSAVVLDEVRGDGDVVNLQSLQISFENVFEEIGKKITSFQYVTEGQSFETYVNLSRLVTFMPNLRDLIVEVKGRNLMDPWEKEGVMKIKAFPTCRRLKRYVEGENGIGVTFLKEILRANPSIQEVHFGETTMEEWSIIKGVLETLHLTKFHATCFPGIPFFQEPFQWAKDLTTLVLWDPSNSWKSGGADLIPSEKFYNFLSSLENLQELMVSTPVIRDVGGSAKLPKLESLVWKVFPVFKNLGFLKSAENLEFLTLDLSKCPDTRRPKEVIEFLGEWNIPVLFPTLKEIKIKTQDGGLPKAVWIRDTGSA